MDNLEVVAFVIKGNVNNVIILRLINMFGILF